MQKHLSTFIKGMDRDTSKNKYPNNKYYNAENLRLTSADGLSSYTLTNIDGNVYTATLDAYSGSQYVINNYTFIRQKLVILSHLANKVNLEDATDRIYSFDIQDDGTLGNKQVLYTGKLELDPNNLVTRIIGRYESDTIQKIYWTNGITERKFCNIVDPNLNTYPSERFNIYPGATSGVITIDTIGAGIIKAGTIQYAYQLYNLYGAQTGIVTTSNLIQLSASNPNLSSDLTFKGSSENTDAFKSVSFTITNSDTNFSRIKVYRIQYFNILTDPTITQILDAGNSSSIVVTDTGEINLGELTIDEYNFINYRFLAQDLETKNNFLFAGNITEEFYDIDWDARAYRFASNRVCTLRKDSFSGAITSTLAGNNPATWVIDKELDCINTFNDISVPISVSTAMMFQANGSTIGAEGLNVKIRVYNDESITLDEDRSSLQSYVTDTNRNSNPISEVSQGGYMYDEIYSFAIVLKNTKGQETPAKWVCDFRTPSMSLLGSMTSISPTKLYGQNIRLRFQVSNLPTDCVSWRIVRCERTNADRTILTQGLVNTTVKSADDSDINLRRPSTTLVSVKEYKANTNHLNVNNSQTIDRTLLDFNSPEINFNKDLNYAGGDFLELIATGNIEHIYRRTVYNAGFSAITSSTDYDQAFGQYIKKVTSITPLTTERITIDDAKLIDSVESYPTLTSGTVTLTTKTFSNYSKNYPAHSWGRGCTRFLIATSNVFNMPSVSDTTGYGEKTMMANYRRAIIPYGGNTYLARASRVYIAASREYTSSENDVYIYGGDTFLSYFELIRTLNMGLDGEFLLNENFMEAVRFPVQSSINIKYRTSDTFNNILTSTNGFLIQESAGQHAKSNTSSGIPSGGLNYQQPNDLYAYNSAYSVGQKARKYYPLDPLQNFNKRFDCRVQYSERKFNNEPIDSWTIWKSLNFKDIDNQYGAITRLLNYNTRLLAWQPSAVAILSVEEREAIPSSGGTGALTIGTGGVLSRYDYVSTACGSRHKDSIIPCRNGVYWYDYDNNAFFVYEPTGNIDNVTKLSGIQSWLYTNINNDNPIVDVITGYDPKYNEVLFTILPEGSWTEGVQTIAYNEIYKVFTGFVTAIPSKYIQHTKYLYSTDDDYKLYIHSHQTANKGQFFNTTYPSKLELIITPSNNTIERFDILEWLTELNVNSSNTFTTLQLTNSYQDSGVLTLSSSNVVRRFRTWRFNQLRDNTGNRFKDNYLHTTFSFDNVSGDKLVIQDIITTHSITAPH